jgi:NAD-dependent SIR2 family protein deacetylase
MGRTSTDTGAGGRAIERDVVALARFVRDHERLFVLTGAGISTASGIPDYRDADGNWRHRRPILYHSFVHKPALRRRYWARAFVGWRRFASARPNASHVALARLEAAGRVRRLVTQNVDGLHQRAGSRAVIDLHGRLDTVVCLACGERSSRDELQRRLEEANPSFLEVRGRVAPDGDMSLEGVDYEGFEVPPCLRCGGVLKPDVVFFGESVPPERVRAAFDALAGSDAMLVAGSSLMVYSGYRFCIAAARAGLPIALVNLGRTRADDEADVKIVRDCGEVLAAAADRLVPPGRPAHP